MVVRRTVEQYKAKWKSYAAYTGKKLFAVSLAGILWVQPIAALGPFGGTVLVAQAAANQTAKLSEAPITSGANLLKYQFITTRSGKQVAVLADVIEVDLTNPYVSLNVMTGRGGQLTTRQSVQGMANETGAVAGVNGDFFPTGGQGVAMGAAVSNGTLLTGPAQLQGMYAFAIKADGTPIIDHFGFSGIVYAEDGSSFPLSGLNQEAYVTEPDKSQSHVNKMFMYTSAWKSEERPKTSSTTPTEVLVQNGMIQQISPVRTALPGTVPADGYILRTHGAATDYVTQHLSVGQKLEATYELVSLSGGGAIQPAELKMMIGGHTLLVDNGAAAAFTRPTASISGSSTVARTAVGYSQDGKKAYLITVEKNSNSSGMTLSELQQFMISIGVWKGLNLDGGGSTTMVTRPLAETSTQLSFTTSNGGAGQRAVANGIGVYTSAPQGTLKGLKVSGPSRLLIGQTGTYTLKGYDNYYNPIDTSSLSPAWKSDNASVTWNGTAFKASKRGSAQITAVSGNTKASMTVSVLGGDALDSLIPSVTYGPLEASAAIPVTVSAKLKNGNTIEVPEASVKWSFTGIKAKVKDGMLQVESINPGAKIAYATPSYDGYTGTPIVLTTTAQQIWENFENVSYPVAFTGLPAESQGTVSIVQGQGDRASSKELRLNYDLTGGTGNKFAYAQLNGTNGKEIPNGSTSMTIDVLGDSSLNWVRAEFADANGKSVYVDITRQLDYVGWRTFDIDLTAYSISQPATLKRLYVVNLEEGQDERALIGSISFDNVRFSAPMTEAQLAWPSATAQMTIGSKSMTVNGKKQNLDVAPLLKSNSTYVPIKYILDTFGGNANWNNKAKKITVTRGATVIELTVEQKTFLINGTKNTADVAPIIVNNRTLVPLRLVSEQLGIDVKWDKKTKSITLES